MTAVITKTVHDRFTPKHYEGQAGAPVYLIMPADLRRRAQLWSTLTALGARLPMDKEMHAAMRQGITEIVVEEERGEAMAIMDALESEQQLTEMQLAQLGVILDGLRGAQFLPLTQVEAAMELYTQLAPLIAAETLLVGWENVKVAFPKKGKMLPEGWLEKQIPENDIRAIGWRALELLRPSDDAKKNLSLQSQ